MKVKSGKKVLRKVPKNMMVQVRFPKPLYLALMAYGESLVPPQTANRAMLALAMDRLRKPKPIEKRGEL